MDQPKPVATPFSGRQETLRKPQNGGKWVVYLVSILCVAFAISTILLLKNKGGGDKYRTLEAFPTSDYLENYESLLGSRFKLNATVDAELGTEESTGKLVTFRDSQSKKIVPVLIPSEVMPNFALSKSQSCQMVIEVGRGGVITATQFEKE